MVAEAWNEPFKKLKQESGLKNEEIAHLVGVSEHTVNSWLYPPTCLGRATCPRFRYETLKFALRKKKPAITVADRQRIRHEYFSSVPPHLR